MRPGAVALILLLSTVAYADPIQELGQALTDRSNQVRVQAAIVLGKLKDRRGVPLLISALSDKEPAVRIVAASSLGKLGDSAALPALRTRLGDSDGTVSAAVSRAIAAIEGTAEPGQPGVGPGPSRYSLELSPTTCGLGLPDAARFAHRELIAQLGQTRGVAVLPVPGIKRYFVDSKLAKLSTSPPDANGRVQVDCDLHIIVATHPDHAIKMMATVGGSVEERNDPKELAEAKLFCIGDAAKQAAEKVQTYLQGQGVK